MPKKKMKKKGYVPSGTAKEQARGLENYSAASAQKNIANRVKAQEKMNRVLPEV